MARKRYSDEDCLKIFRQAELDLAGGADVAKVYTYVIPLTFTAVAAGLRRLWYR